MKEFYFIAGKYEDGSMYWVDFLNPRYEPERDEFMRKICFSDISIDMLDGREDVSVETSEISKEIIEAFNNTVHYSRHVSPYILTADSVINYMEDEHSVVGYVLANPKKIMV